MRYLKAGSGPPLILVHGLMGYSFSWRFTIPALAPHATVYAIDNLGAGLSHANEGMDCSLRATAERLLQFVDALGLQDFDLLGTSHGGGVAIMVAALCAEKAPKKAADSETSAAKHPRLQRLILVAPINPGHATASVSPVCRQSVRFRYLTQYDRTLAFIRSHLVGTPLQ